MKAKTYNVMVFYVEYTCDNLFQNVLTVVAKITQTNEKRLNKPKARNHKEVTKWNIRGTYIKKTI